MDSSFTLVEERRGSARAKLTCIGRDIEYRELELRRNEENVWELVSDNREQPALGEGRIVCLLSELMGRQKTFIGTPTELSKQIDPEGVAGITPKKVSRMIMQSLDALRERGITAMVRRSNGKRIVELHRAESADAEGVPDIDPIDPAATTLSANNGETGAGDGESSPWGGQAEPSSDFVGLGSAGKPAHSGQKPGPTLELEV